MPQGVSWACLHEKIETQTTDQTLLNHSRFRSFTLCFSRIDGCLKSILPRASLPYQSDRSPRVVILSLSLILTIALDITLYANVEDRLRTKLGKTVESSGKDTEIQYETGNRKQINGELGCVPFHMSCIFPVSLLISKDLSV
jgi:hypothetical protein